MCSPWKDSPAVSHSADLRNRPRDGGFSLIEIIVAIAVLTTVMVALLPQLIVGIRSTGTARLVTQAKGIAQGELDRMRAMPFYLSKATGGVDLLDTYYPRVTGTSPSPTCVTGGNLNAPQTSWSGYVSASATRCSYEPAGAFYRVVRPAVDVPNLGRFIVVIATQFLSGDQPPKVLTPQADYDSQVPGAREEAPATQVGVTTTVIRSDRGKLRPITTYTQLDDRNISEAAASVKATVKAVDVGSVTTDAGPMSFVAGQLDLLGSTSTAISTSANVAATTAGLSSGVQASGASTSAQSPPTVNSLPVNSPAGALPVGGCLYACWGPTYVGPVSATAEDSLPRAGTPTAPLQAMITDASQNSGFTVGNSQLISYAPALLLTGSLVKLDPSATPMPSSITNCAPSSGGTSAYVSAGGYLLTNSPKDTLAPYRVESCAVARTTALSILPTAFAPGGIVRVELTRAAAHCQLDGSGHTPTVTHDYQAIVQYWNGTSYVTAGTIVPGTTTDPLAAVPLTTPVDPLGVHKLGDYIASWSSVTQDKVTSIAKAGTASVNVPGVVTIATQPVRADGAGGTDPSSGVSIAIGAIGCSVGDVR
jgi:prepilin-type N-terminal cleavage/methylation domain-containing protein